MLLEIFASTAIVTAIGDLAAESKQTIHQNFAHGIALSVAPQANSYARACTLAAQQSTAEWVLFLAPCVQADERLAPALAALAHAITHAPTDTAVFELRQFPLETGHHYNPITLETDTIDLEAFAYRRAVYLAVGGLDAQFALHTGFEFSRRVRAMGYRLSYLPRACVTVLDAHDALAAPTCEEYTAALGDDILLAAKYGSIGALRRAKMRYFAAIRQPKHYPSVRKVLLRHLFKLAVIGWGRFLWRHTHRALFQKVRVGTWDFESVPQRGRVPQYALQETPLVSVVIRTCNRPAVLRETLRCLRHQTYNNFEIILIEDGAPTAQELVAREFTDLPINYFATQTNVGRGRAGNIGIERAKGDFVCFLDDDDFYYADYIETCVAYLQSEDGLDFLYTPIMAFEADVTSRTPEYHYTITRTYPVLFDHLTLMDMCVKCRVPMSGGMFRRALYGEIGGMREDIDGDEDWAMWLRYTMIGKRKNPYALDIRRALSVCGFPADPTAAQARHLAYEKFDFDMLSDPNLKFTIQSKELLACRTQTVQDLAHLQNLGTLAATLEDEGRKKWPRFRPVFPQDENETMTLTALEINGYYQTILDEVANGAQISDLMAE